MNATLRRPLHGNDPRTVEELQLHYRVERALADKLRQAKRTERMKLYSAVYDELFRAVPSHPQLTRKDLSQEAARARMAWQTAILSPFVHPDTVFLEVGAGDCLVTREMCRRVKAGYAAEVARLVPESEVVPSNFHLTLFDGLTLPLPNESIDLAYSNQLMEHLHPEDAESQLRSIYSVIKPGGRYICITPNRIGGPWDVSEHFDEAATGLHLKEYTFRELAALMRRVGFRKVSALVGGRGHYWRCPMWPLTLIERALNQFPTEMRFRTARHPLLRFFLGIRLIATK